MRATPFSNVEKWQVVSAWDFAILPSNTFNLIPSLGTFATTFKIAEAPNSTDPFLLGLIISTFNILL